MAARDDSPTSATSDDGVPPDETTGDPRANGQPDDRWHVHIVILGLMGSGKSTVGRIVANELGRPFVDSDSIVELRSGHLPYELADRDGLDELHDVEASAARHVLATSRAVVFAAAASVTEMLTAEELSRTWSAWLDASPAVLARRMAGDRPRPALDPSPEEALAEQYRERAQRGRELAQLVVDTDVLTATEVAEEICAGWRRSPLRSETTSRQRTS